MLVEKIGRPADGSGAADLRTVALQSYTTVYCGYGEGYGVDAG
jgi:hypothetical protein